MARINRSEWVANVHLTPRGAVPPPSCRMAGSMRAATARKAARKAARWSALRTVCGLAAIVATGLSFTTF